jgi:hypothetical protein
MAISGLAGSPVTLTSIGVNLPAHRASDPGLGGDVHHETRRGSLNNLHRPPGLSEILVITLMVPHTTLIAAVKTGLPSWVRTVIPAASSMFHVAVPAATALFPPGL